MEGRMDNLTHTAIGLFLSRAGLNRLTPRATPILLLAANAPDLDVVSAAGGSIGYLHYHRHLTHSLAALPLLAILCVAAVRFIGRKPVNWTGAIIAAAVGLASHVVLDWTNIYGIRMLLPFSAEWLRLDITNVVDLWIWAICLLGIAGPFLSRLVGSEIASGGDRARHHGQGFAIFALLFVLTYNSGRAVLHARAEAGLSSRLYEGALPDRVFAAPDTLNPFRWRGVVETSNAFVVQDLNLVAPDPLAARPVVFHKPDPDPAIDAARRDPVIREFLAFAQIPLWRVSPWQELENGRLVEVFDMRFGSPAAPGFMARAILNGRGQVVRTDFAFGSPRAR
jgi:inner membrane protein